MPVYMGRVVGSVDEAPRAGAQGMEVVRCEEAAMLMLMAGTMNAQWV